MVRREDGFTLAETVVVLAVAAILMGVIGTGANYWIEEQRNMSLETLNEQANQALVTYYAIYGYFPFHKLTADDGSRPIIDLSNDSPQELSEEESRRLMEELSKVTSQRVVQDYDPAGYKLEVTYSNEYVAGMEFERR